MASRIQTETAANMQEFVGKAGCALAYLALAPIPAAVPAATLSVMCRQRDLWVDRP